jgi:hypothetical protein
MNIWISQSISSFLEGVYNLSGMIIINGKNGSDRPYGLNCFQWKQHRKLKLKDILTVMVHIYVYGPLYALQEFL